jgi:hypothetical protein
LAERKPIEQTRDYLRAFVAALAECVHTDENINSVLEELAGVPIPTPEPDATLIWNAYAVGGGYWGIQVHNPDLRGGTKLYAQPLNARPVEVQSCEQPDCADIISGALGVSRGYAYELMAEAVAAAGVREDGNG